MKVYVVQAYHATGSWGDRDSFWIEGVVDSEEKAMKQAEEAANKYVSESYSATIGYPKIIKTTENGFVVADSQYEEDRTRFYYTEYEVG